MLVIPRAPLRGALPVIEGDPIAIAIVPIAGLDVAEPAIDGLLVAGPPIDGPPFIGESAMLSPCVSQPDFFFVEQPQATSLRSYADVVSPVKVARGAICAVVRLL